VAPTTLVFTQAEKKVIAVGDVMEIPAEGGTFAVDVQYNTDIVVEVESTAQSWIHFVAVRALTSGKLEFSFDANPNPDVRTGKVTVKDKNGKVAPTTLIFTQAEKKVIAVGDVMEIPAEGGTFAVDVQYNTDVVVEIESAAQSWIHFVAVRALTSGKLEFSFTENPSTAPREGKVTIKDKNGKAEPVTLSFSQEGNSPFIDFKDPEVKAICIQLWDRSGNRELSEREAAAVTELGYRRFENMGIHSFDELRFFTGIKTIPDYCFRYCTKLESITLPAELESIGECAFLECSALKGDLVLPDKIKTIEDFAFCNCGFTGSLTLPESLEKLGYGAFDGCEGFTGDLTIPRGTKTIEGQCFLYCSGIKGELTIPETVSSIGYLAFGYTDFSKAKILSQTPAECNNYAFEGSDYLIYVPSGTAKTYQQTPGWIEYRGRITEEGHDPAEYFYASTDYSRDGEVVCLQQATKGKGIDLILMGDGFVDKDMEPGGKYETLLRRWMEQLFVYEPYKSFREWFSVYAVKVVSKHEVFNCPSSERKLTRDDGDGDFGNTISTLNSIAIEYASLATSGPLRITVFMNTEEKNVGRSFCGYGSGGYFNAWVFDSIDRRPSTFIHESGGHGFGWLGDEYTEFNTTFTNYESLDRNHNVGFYPNLDWRNDPETVYWSHFLKDPRYSKEGLGIFEGGDRYTYGIYRPTMNSMMRYDFDKGAVFNAPGREAIYKRIMQWGSGNGWEYDYETFVAADEAGRKQAADAYAEYPPTRSHVQRDDMEPGLPPILVDESVKEIRITKGGKVSLIR
ncbi:MAG: leucine-rich repeat protein, partial [Bacteroidales bacterium]|nr:leucine-rich repeat protein [Bacteroidales bacterium]